MESHFGKLPLLKWSDRQLGWAKGHRCPGLHFDEGQGILVFGNNIHLTHYADIILFDNPIAFLLQKSKGLLLALLAKFFLFSPWLASVIRVRNQSPLSNQIFYATFSPSPYLPISAS